MEKLEWHTEKRKVNDLIPYEENPRMMTQKQKEDLEESLKRFNLMSIPVVNTNNIIVSGHQRLKILQLLDRGEEAIDVRIPNRKLTLKELKEANLRENKNLGSWDYDLLANIDKEFLLDVGFTEEELDDKFNLAGGKGDEDNFDVDKALEEIKKPICQREDIWQLGEHRLMCGDATVEENVKWLMDGKKADVVFTDPPYGINLDVSFAGMPSRWKNRKYLRKYMRPVIGDDKPFDAGFIFELFKCKEIFLWGAEHYIDTLPYNGKKGGWFVWDKRVEENFDRMYGNAFELCWSKVRHKREISRIKWACRFGTEKEPDKERFHPTQKPVLLADWFIRKFSKKREIIVDIFGGVGTTLLACEQLNRYCYMMEIDPIYCDVIIKRWENYSNKKAVKINGNKRRADRRS